MPLRKEGHSLKIPLFTCCKQVLFSNEATVSDKSGGIKLIKEDIYSTIKNNIAKTQKRKTAYTKGEERRRLLLL
jgi:hypothetical protein